MKKSILGALFAALAGGCGDTGTDLLFDLDLVVVTNNADDFSIAGVSTALTTTRTYSWSCSTGQANLSIGSTLSNGSIRLEVHDNAGNLVHDNTYCAVLIGGITAFTKSGGAAGTWTLKFTFDHALFTGAITVKADTLSNADGISVGGTGALDGVLIFEPGWNTTALNVSIGGVSSGNIHVTITDGAGFEVFNQTNGAVTALNANPSGAAGVWLVQIDFDHTVGAGAVTISQP
jgi:hypothetical protein